MNLFLSALIKWYETEYGNYRSQKFEDPAEGEDTLVAKFKKLYEDLTAGFRALEDETR